jgi:diguanylate cyclase (GGDEF)-like protein
VGTHADDAGERIRSAVGDTPIDTNAGPLPVTVSAGVAVFDSGQDADLDVLLARADRALYDAKEAGRNRVVIYHR